MSTHLEETETGTYIKAESQKDGKRRKSRKLPPSFASDQQGQNIRNAVTGSYYDERVGSIEEKRLFKVVGKSAFKMNSDGVVLDEGYNMSSFYYDSPEQYEQHKRTVLPSALKESWRLNAVSDNSTAQNMSGAPHCDTYEDAMKDDVAELDDMVDGLDKTTG